MAHQDAFQGEQTESDKTFDSKPVVVVTRLALVFHTAQTHPDPRIELVKPFSIGAPRGAEVMSGAPNNSVEFLDDTEVEVVLSACMCPHLFFEFLDRLGPHPPRVRPEHKSQKGVTFAERCDTGFLRTQGESQVTQDGLHFGQRLLGLGLGLGQHHKVVGIPREAETGGVELPIQMIENDVGKKRRNDATLWSADGRWLEPTVFYHP